jgi:hypothetical protein
VAEELSMALEVDSEDVEELVETTVLSWPLRSCRIIIWGSSKKWLRNCLQRRRGLTVREASHCRY